MSNDPNDVKDDETIDLICRGRLDLFSSLTLEYDEEARQLIGEDAIGFDYQDSD